MSADDAVDEEDGLQLIQELSDLERSSAQQSRRSQQILRSVRYMVPLQDGTQEDEDKVQLRSWRMLDWAYKRDPSPFPTQARGLFTSLDPKLDRKIVVRGYDKFFNTGEVSWTRWENIPNFAKGPFHLTVKSNGCIIFISALTPDQLIITSKHAWGNSQKDGEVSHAAKGEQWLDQSLNKVNKSRQDLCEYLWQNNCTAVAELCDDSFEEHVLAYSAEQTGLHLHGINLNSRVLRTLPPDLVADKAVEFGFIPTKFVTLNTIEEVKASTDACEQDDGRWNGEHVEGFVVRSLLRQPPNGTSSRNPSSFGQKTFMFKIKFDQPYLRWRRWRELTRRMISNRKKDVPYRKDDLLFGVKMTKSEHPHTRAYVEWVAERLHTNPDDFQEWQHSRGIVKTREEFLAFFESQPHAAAVDSSNGAAISDRQADEANKTFDGTLIVPIAVPGCGKTAIGLALSSLFGFAHTQSDNIQVKNPKALFLKDVQTLLGQNNVVFADRNNHLIQHRSDLIAVTAHKSLKSRKIRKIALWWNIDELPSDEVYSVCLERIMQRGQNHQSLRVDEASRAHEAILRKFIHEHDPFDPVANGESDGEFDENIELDPRADRNVMLDSVVQRLLEILHDIKRPNPEALKAAIDKGAEYTPDVYKEIKAPKARYYAVSIPIQLAEFVRSVLPCAEIPAIFHQLVHEDRIVHQPHITLVHNKEVQSEDAEPGFYANLWKECSRLSRLEGEEAIEVTVNVGPRIAYNDRVMALEVTSMEAPGKLSIFTGSENKPRSFHITVGFTDQAEGAVEGKYLIASLLQEGPRPSGQKDFHSHEIGLHAFIGKIQGMY